MASKENTKKADRADDPGEEIPAMKILTSKQEVADELSMGIQQFSRLLRKYPFIDGAGVSGKLNGRWHVPAEYAHRWHIYALKQGTRHPDSRRMRPQEPPGLTEIVGR